MITLFPLLMLLGVQDTAAPAQDTAPFKHGIWTGQCWPTGLKSGPLCRATGGVAGKMWLMIERRPGGLDIYASAACGADLPAVTVAQGQLAGADRVGVVKAAITDAVGKANVSCKSSEAVPGTGEDLAALLTATDMIAGGATKQ